MQLAKAIAHLADDKKAENVVLLDMRPCVSYCDYFVLCSGDTETHVRAIAEGISEGLGKLGLKVWHKQGLKELGRRGARGFDSDDFHGAWVLLDTGDVVAHILETEARDFYELEHLWRDAAKLDWRK